MSHLSSLHRVNFLTATHTGYSYPNYDRLVDNGSSRFNGFPFPTRIADLTSGYIGDGSFAPMNLSFWEAHRLYWRVRRLRLVGNLTIQFVSGVSGSLETVSNDVNISLETRLYVAPAFIPAYLMKAEGELCGPGATHYGQVIPPGEGWTATDGQLGNAPDGMAYHVQVFNTPSTVGNVIFADSLNIRYANFYPLLFMSVEFSGCVALNGGFPDVVGIYSANNGTGNLTHINYDTPVKGRIPMRTANPDETVIRNRLTLRPVYSNLTRDGFWPYAAADGSPIYNTANGLRLQSPLN